MRSSNPSRRTPTKGHWLHDRGDNYLDARRFATTAAQLHQVIAAARIERTLRSIQRQLETLVEASLIECDARSKPYGYKRLANALSLSVAALSPQESLLLILAEQHLRNLLPPALLKSMAGFFDNARRNLETVGGNTDARDTRFSREWLDKVQVVSASQPLISPSIDPQVFEAVSDALYLNHWLKLIYTNQKGEKRNSDVMPLGMAQQGTRLYLVCRFEGFENERSLAMNRISGATTTGRVFERPKDFNLEQYDDDGRFGLGDGTKIRLQFKIQKSAGLHLLESKLSVDQTFVEHQDCYEIAATLVETAQLTWWLRGFGDAVWGITKLPAPS